MVTKKLEIFFILPPIFFTAPLTLTGSNEHSDKRITFSATILCETVPLDTLGALSYTFLTKCRIPITLLLSLEDVTGMQGEEGQVSLNLQEYGSDSVEEGSNGYSGYHSKIGVRCCNIYPRFDAHQVYQHLFQETCALRPGT